MKILQLLFSGAAVSIAVGACAGSDGDLQQACVESSEIQCEKEGACAPLFTKYIYGDVAKCKERRALACTALRPTGTGFTPERVLACAHAKAGLACEAYFHGEVIDECRVSGSLPLRAACSTNGQCQSSFCRFEGGGCGVCSELAKAGDFCAGNADCERGMVCRDAICVHGLDHGEACDPSNSRCKGFCDVTSGGGICKSTVIWGVGTPCNPAQDRCEGSILGLACSSETSTCQSVVSVRPAGGACDSNARCEASGWCNEQRICVAALPDGARCDGPGSSTGPFCTWPAQCNKDSVCEVVDLFACP